MPKCGACNRAVENGIRHYRNQQYGATVSTSVKGESQPLVEVICVRNDDKEDHDDGGVGGSGATFFLTAPVVNAISDTRTSKLLNSLYRITALKILVWMKGGLTDDAVNAAALHSFSVSAACTSHRRRCRPRWL